MAVVLVDVMFFVVVLVMGLSLLTISTTALDTCFYSFHTTESNWEKSNQICQDHGGNVVSMETEEEYQFINETIQGLDKGKQSYKNEWYIGLRKRVIGDWKWVSEHNMTINKWRPTQPNYDGWPKCVKMLKSHLGYYGLFDDLSCKVTLMFICEYKNVTPKQRCKKTENEILVNSTCYHLKDIKRVNPTSFVPTSTIENTKTKTKGKEETSRNLIQTTISRYTTSSISITSASARKEQPFRMKLVVIVLAVLLAVCICMFVAVFCWFRKKSEQKRRKAKSSRNPLERSTATRPVAPQDQSNLTNAYTEGVQIVSRDAVLYDVPVDDIDYPRTGTHTREQNNLYSTDLSAYSDVHDAIQPSAKLNTNYNDDENHYLNPVDTPPTLDAIYYEKVELNPKPFQNTTCKNYKKHPQMEKAVADPSAKQQGYLEDATNEPVTCSSLYATAELNSMPNKAPNKSSKRDLEQQYENVVTNETASCNSLYATTDLSSKEYRDGAEPTQHMDDTNSAPCYYNNLYASTDLKYLHHQATNEGLQRDSNGCLKEDKPRGSQTEAGNSGNTNKSRHPSIGSIMSASRKSYPTPSIPPLYKQPKQDTMMYAMVDLLDKDEELNMLNTQVDKKDKKRKK